MHTLFITGHTHNIPTQCFLSHTTSCQHHISWIKYWIINFYSLYDFIFNLWKYCRQYQWSFITIQRCYIEKINLCWVGLSLQQMYGWFLYKCNINFIFFYRYATLCYVYLLNHHPHLGVYIYLLSSETKTDKPLFAYKLQRFITYTLYNHCSRKRCSDCAYDQYTSKHSHILHGEHTV